MNTVPLTVADALAPNVIHVRGEQRPADVRAAIGRHDVVFIVDEEVEPGAAALLPGGYLGLVTAREIALHPLRIFADLVVRPRHLLALGTPLEEAGTFFESGIETALPVIKDARLVGAVTVVSIRGALLARERELLARTRADAAHLAGWSTQLETLHVGVRNLLEIFGHRVLEAETLERAIAVQVSLVGARYGAIGLVGPRGELTSFVTAGMTEAERAKLGALPTGKGLLGVVVEREGSMRLEDLRAHPSFTGFPAGHPDMRQFLAVAIKDEARTLGRIYLCDKLSGEPFSDDDVRLTKCLADSIGALLLSARAVAHQRQLEAMLRQAQKLEALGRLAGGIAHDFNNLLTVMMSGAEELLEAESPPPEAEVHRCAEDILHAVKRAASLTNQLLAFGRRRPPIVQRIDLAVTITDTAKMLQRVLGDDVVLVVEQTPDLPVVNADAAQICQLLLNLAINSRDAMESGGRLYITTRVQPDASAVVAGSPVGPGAEIEVRDTGTGIAPDVMEHLFEPFFTTKGPGKGTGLGLANVYAIVREFGGHIAVASEPGAGATFTISFPACTKAVADSAPALAPKQRATISGATVLLVDDSDLVRRALGQVLRRHGYDVIDAADGMAVLDLPPERIERVRLVITDVEMPGISGPALVAKLRARSSSIQALFLSGAASVELHDEDAFLQKPVSASTLLAKVHDLIEPLTVA